MDSSHPDYADIKRFFDSLTPRHLEAYIHQCLDEKEVVMITGALSSGKSLLCEKISTERDLEYFSFDEETIRAWSQGDPKGVAQMLKKEGAVMDEVQRAPNFIAILKMLMKEKLPPGRVLFCASIDMFRSKMIPDDLLARIAHIPLYPFSQGEIEGLKLPSNLLSVAFKDGFSLREIWDDGNDVWFRGLRGGYPEAVKEEDIQSRQDWFRGYVHLLTNFVGKIESGLGVYKPYEFSRLISCVAELSGDFVNLSALGKKLGVNSQTVDRWLSLLEDMYVLRRVPNWQHPACSKNLIKAPRLYLLDPALIAALRGWRLNDRGNLDYKIRVSYIKEFVFAELTRLIAVDPDSGIQLYGYRQRFGVEVDFLLIRGDQVVGVQAVGVDHVYPRDLKGFDYLKSRLGKNFVCGLVFHTGKELYKYTDRIYAAPVSRLWCSSSKN